MSHRKTRTIKSRFYVETEGVVFVKKKVLDILHADLQFHSYQAEVINVILNRPHRS